MMLHFQCFTWNIAAIVSRETLHAGGAGAQREGGSTAGGAGAERGRAGAGATGGRERREGGRE